MNQRNRYGDDNGGKYKPPPAQQRFDNTVDEGGGSFGHLPKDDNRTDRKEKVVGKSG